ncbi:hypothetical protein Tco_0162898 [Tanacetum coccineum]
MCVCILRENVDVYSYVVQPQGQGNLIPVTGGNTIYTDHIDLRLGGNVWFSRLDTWTIGWMVTSDGKIVERRLLVLGFDVSSIGDTSVLKQKDVEMKGDLKKNAQLVGPNLSYGVIVPS